MITLVEGFPEDTVAIHADGEVTAADYDAVVKPAVEAAIARYGTIDVYYQIGPAFAGMEFGAMMRDMRIGLGHLRAFRRIAIVTDQPWIAHAVHALGFLMPAATRCFPLAATAEAKAFLAAA